MAILMRGGVYDDFDPNKLLPREFAVVLSNDTSTRDGKAIYICFGPGKVKRISTFEDMRDDMENAGAEVFEQYGSAFREILAQVQALAAQTEQYKDAVNAIRNDIVNTYMPQIQAAAAHAAAAKNSADSSANSAKLSESWAVGGTGTRVGEDSDNSKYYSNEAADLVEEAKRIIAASSSGALIPIDTRPFEDLPITSTPGYMYNISNDFVTDDRFVDGAGRFYGSGNNVYWTSDGMWDVLAGIQAAEDFVGTMEEAERKLSAGELADGTTLFTYEDDVPGQVIILDDELSETSENAVKNKVITSSINELRRDTQTKIVGVQKQINTLEQNAISKAGGTVTGTLKAQTMVIGTTPSTEIGAIWIE